MLCVCGVYKKLWENVEVKKRLETQKMSSLIVTIDGKSVFTKDVDHCWLNKSNWTKNLDG